MKRAFFSDYEGDRDNDSDPEDTPPLKSLWQRTTKNLSRPRAFSAGDGEERKPLLDEGRVGESSETVRDPETSSRPKPDANDKRPIGASSASSRHDDMFDKLEEIADLSNSNVRKLLSRGENLNQLQNQAESLGNVGNMFKRRMRRVARTNYVSSSFKEYASVIGYSIAAIVLLILMVSVMFTSSGTTPKQPPWMIPPAPVPSQPGPVPPSGGIPPPQACQPPIYYPVPVPWPYPGYPYPTPVPAPPQPIPSQRPAQLLATSVDANLMYQAQETPAWSPYQPRSRSKRQSRRHTR